MSLMRVCAVVLGGLVALLLACGDPLPDQGPRGRGDGGTSGGGVSGLGGEGDLRVDTTRVFAMGFSYGGGMSHAICASEQA